MSATRRSPHSYLSSRVLGFLVAVVVGFDCIGTAFAAGGGNIPVAAQAIAECEGATARVGMGVAPPGQPVLPPEPPSLDSLRAAAPYRDNDKAADVDRLAAVRQAALSLGMRAGFNRGIWCHQREISAQASRLDQMYNFGALLFEAGGGFLYEPGIVNEEFDNRSVARDGTRAAAAAQRITLPAKEVLVTRPRSWKDYLIVEIEPLAPVDPHTRPRDEDKAAWDGWVADGWKRGLRQAAATMDELWNRLDRDFLGMVTYRRMVLEKRLDPPRALVIDRGITGNHDEVRVGDVEVKTVRAGQLQPNSVRWQPLPFITDLAGFASGSQAVSR